MNISNFLISQKNTEHYQWGYVIVSASVEGLDEAKITSKIFFV